VSCFPLPSQPPKKMPAQRILVLDDEPNIGSSLRLILEREGYAVTIARSIADAKAPHLPPMPWCWTSVFPTAAASIFCASSANAIAPRQPS